MSYITNQLNPGENLVATARYHPANFFSCIMFLFFGLIGVFIVLVLTPGVSITNFIHYIPTDYKKLHILLDFKSNDTGLYFLLYIFIIMLYILSFINLFFTSIRLYSTHLALTDRRIIGKAGIITRQTLDTPLNKIDTIKITKGTRGLIFNYGKMHILTTTEKFVFKGIANPEDFKQKIFSEINRP
jgi:uncharacterized membrane protein YdbT with pleckstrin-like domain